MTGPSSITRHYLRAKTDYIPIELGLILNITFAVRSRHLSKRKSLCSTSQYGDGGSQRWWRLMEPSAHWGMIYYFNTHTHKHTHGQVLSPRTLEQWSPPSPNRPTQTNKSLFINTDWKWRRGKKKGWGKLKRMVERKKGQKEARDEGGQ